MSEENLDENPEEIDEPMSPNELLMNIIQDLVVNANPNDVGTEFIAEFVLQGERPETAQILQMLDLPAETLVEMMQGVLEQSYQTQLQALNTHGATYFEGLKAAVKTQMTELAE
jgi:hypothetical protein